MLAQESELAELTAPIPEPVVAPPEPEVAVEPDVSLEGPIPAPAAAPADIAELQPGKTASEQAFGDPAASTHLYEPAEYRAACITAGTPEKWDDRYVHGHTEAHQWKQPYEGRFDMVFLLKHGFSASQAVKDLLKGPTIANRKTLAVAYEIDLVREQIGDRKFDALFGSSVRADDARIPTGQRLKITPGMLSTPFRAQMIELADKSGEVDKRKEPEEPAALAEELEERPAAAMAEEPASVQLAEELGVQRDQEFDA